MLPANFWEEFDRIIEEKLNRILDKKLEEKLEEKLDKKLEEKLDRILDEKLDKKFDEKLDKKFDEKLDPLKKSIKKLVNWTQRQDESIEREMTSAMKSHLQEYYKGYITVEPKIFPKEVLKPDGTVLTEFDGIMILTNTKQYTDIVVPDKLNKSSSPKFSKDTELFVVIVEAKQHLTMAKVTRKIAQKESIEQYIKDVQAGIIEAEPSLKRVMIDKFKPNVGLYIGGIDVDLAAQQRINEYAQTHQMCGIIDLNGMRFSVKDTTNGFGTQQFGGKRKK